MRISLSFSSSVSLSFSLAIIVCVAMTSIGGCKKPCNGTADCSIDEICDADGFCIPEPERPVIPVPTEGEGEGEGEGEEEPPECGTDAPQILRLSGDNGETIGEDRDFVHPGDDTITDGVWSATFLVETQGLTVGVDPTNAEEQGLFWSLRIGAPEGDLLAPGTYEDAERFSGPNIPALDFSGDGRGCNEQAGSFTLDEFELDAATNEVLLVSVTFVQFCEGNEAALRGCVHYEAP